MRNCLVVMALLMTSACMGGGSETVAPSPQAPSAPSPEPNAADNTQFGTLLNGARMAEGAADVAFDARLASAATAHANDMLVNDFFSHTGSNGSTVGERATAAGYNWTRIGENIAQGQSNEQEVFTAWQNSRGHRANNLDPGFEDFGLAKVGTGSDARWVLVLGAE